MHNHLVRGNVPPFGGWDAFRPQEANALPVWTKDAGYYNLHIGKYLNGYAGVLATPLPVPTAWDEWYGKISEGPLYFNYQLIEKTAPADTPELEFYGDQAGEYQTDVLGDKAVGFLDGLSAGAVPVPDEPLVQRPPLPLRPGAPSHRLALDRPGCRRSRPSTRRTLGQAEVAAQAVEEAPFEGTQKTIPFERRRRLEMLRSVDEAVGELVAELEARVLDDTYIVFASDNGFFRGEHRIAGGKYLAYDPSSKVPLMIRGPGIPAGSVSDELVSTLDITQTIVEIATGSTDPALDGRSLIPYAQNNSLRSTRPLLIEADTGPGNGGPGFDPESASASGAVKAQEARVAGRRGVKDLDQEKMASKSVANGNFAPAYRAIRTDRYLYALYGNGQTRDLRHEARPGQQNSLTRTDASGRSGSGSHSPGRVRHVRRSFMPLRDGPRAEAAAEGEETARRDRGGRRVRR